MRYGVIGTGWIAKSFIDGARQICGSEFTAVYSRTTESGNKFAAENNIETVYTDINEFAKGDFDAVYIASPNSLHYEQSKLMLENGKHVICEKPITVEPRELRELQTLAEKNGLIYVEAIMYMFNPARNLLKDAVNRIGRITSAHFDFSQLSSISRISQGRTSQHLQPEIRYGLPDGFRYLLHLCRHRFIRYARKNNRLRTLYGKRCRRKRYGNSALSG